MLSKLFASRSYYYFDNYAQLQSQKLNFIEVMLRKLGFFRHTHLNEVVRSGYEYTLSGRFIAKPAKEKALVKLFSKSMMEFPLPAYTTDTGEHADISIRYLSSDSKINSITFKVNDTSFSFFRKEDRYIISIPAFEGMADDTHQSIQKRFSSNEAKAITQIINHAIHDSASSVASYLFRLHIDDYRYLPSHDNRPLNANILQARELSKLNWIYERQVQGSNPPKISFRPTGPAALKNYQTLSLVFAMNNL